MKRFLILVSVAGASLQIGRMLESGSKTAAAGGGQGSGGAEECAAKNGDVNADGTLNLADGIYIINYQFLGGPQPVPICAPAPSGLPDTGQTKCYAGDGSVIPCDSGTCPGQDGHYATGCPNDANRFTDNLDGTVTDHCTGLMWQKETADVNGDGQTPDGSDALRWCNALAYCENLSFAGHDDWRLPNVRELQSIVDYGRIGPSIDPVFGAVSNFHWSSTSYADGPADAWIVHFNNGYVASNGAEVHVYYVRAVRSGP